MTFCEVLDEKILRSIRILIFVDKDKPEPVRIAQAYGLDRFEQLNCFEEQIVKVECLSIDQ